MTRPLTWIVRMVPACLTPLHAVVGALRTAAARRRDLANLRQLDRRTMTDIGFAPGAIADLAPLPQRGPSPALQAKIAEITNFHPGDQETASLSVAEIFFAPDDHKAAA